MPPKKLKKKPSGIIRIDPNKHADKLKEIEEHIKEEELAAEEAALEALLEEEEEESESSSEEGLWEEYSEIEPAIEVGRIDLSFPESAEEFETSQQCYPPSYYTLSPKERMLLLYAENFRKQFYFSNPTRRPLVLALPNECHVQKFVCTTIRPTSFLHIPLIRSDTGCASFVADFIMYETLEDMMKFPTRLVSPASLLRRRRGNSFEMATLLCSMLIGAGYPAMVVSGVARAETVLNDQRNVKYPHEIVEIQTEDEVQTIEQTGQKYRLRPLPDLTSHLQENLAKLMKEKEEAEQLRREETERLERDELELRATDRYQFRRSHAWIVIIDNAPWSIHPPKTYVNEEGDTVPQPPKARFIEPTTGFACETDCKQYVLIDSVWNDYNYYVNRQKYQRVGEIRWDLRSTDDWEHMLAGEPIEMRMHAFASDENVAEYEPPVNEEKHLDAIGSWVMKLHIGLREFEERYPKLEKSIRYKRALHERFAPYSEADGKVMRLTLFSDDEYTDAEVRWEYYENRGDFLQQSKYYYATSMTEETFDKGRNDNLKFMEFSADRGKPKILHFYSSSRLDSLKYLEVHMDRLLLNYSDRRDRCYHQDFEYKPTGQTLKKVIEKFNRNPDIPAVEDIQQRTIIFIQNKIMLRFHYERGALTCSTIEYTRPPKPEYGQELVYNPALTKFYKANSTDPDPSYLRLYQTLLAQLAYEDNIKKQFEKILEEVTSIFEQRRIEMKFPMLKFRIFDPLRNGAAKAIRAKKALEEERLRAELSTKPPDFLSPYLVPYKNRQLTYEESWAAYNDCLNDLRTRFVNLLNDLQRQYEDLTSEAKALRRFLNKFEDQFSDYDYDRLIQEAKDIELNKRMVQQRLTLTHEESQKKYETVKEALMIDTRLNLQPRPSVEGK